MELAITTTFKQNILQLILLKALVEEGLLSQNALLLQCPKVRWSECKLCQKRIYEENLPDEYCLQSWFIGRINTFLMKCGKRLIGWDEILEGGLNPGTLVMSWRASSFSDEQICPLCMLCVGLRFVT